MFARAENVVFEIVDERAVLVGADGAELITLNPVGTQVWESLVDPGDANALADRLLPVFEGVTLEQLRDDIGAFLDELRDAGLVVEPTS